MITRSCTHAAREGGEVFVREGQTSREFVLIVSGSVAVIRQGFPEVVLGSDEWFGDVELLSDGTSSATMIALTDVECIVMSRPEFACLFDAVPSFRKRLVRSVASIARENLALSEGSAMRVRARGRTFSCHLPRIDADLALMNRSEHRTSEA